AGVSQPQLLQILGHRKIDTYLRHYQLTEVRVDVQATFFGTTSKANMIKEIGRLCIRDDSNLPRSLTPEQRIQVLRDPEIQRLEQLSGTKCLQSEWIKIYAYVQRRRELKTKCQDDNADSALRHAEYTAIGKQLQSMKRTAEKKLFQQILWDYHATADRKHMFAQLKNEPVLAARLSQADFPFEEHQRLAAALFQEMTEESFAQIVEDLSTLCIKSEAAQQGFRMTALLQAQVASLDIYGPAIHNEPSSAATDTTVADFLCLSTCDKTPKPQDHFHVIEDVIEGSGALPITSTSRERLGGFTRAHALRAGASKGEKLTSSRGFTPCEQE
ncbi:MAG: hypothetical protein Q9194_007663, partial [Teloschistes cf. exilis]